MKQTKWSIVLFSFAALILLSACNGLQTFRDSRKEHNEVQAHAASFSMIERSELPTMDPALASDSVSFNALNNAMEGLFRQGPDNQLVLGMAKQKPEILEDNKTYVFHLREDAVWSNGESVTAEDFVFAWRRAVTPGMQAPYRHLFSSVIKNASDIINGKKPPEELGVYALSPTTLKVELEQAHTDFERLLALPVFFPLNEEFVEAAGHAFGKTDETVLSNGPFEIMDWEETGSKWTYVKNDRYWDASQVDVEKIGVDVIKNSANSLSRFENGQSDWVPATGDMLNHVDKMEETKEYPTSSTIFLKFNLDRCGHDSPLKNQSIRKALGLVINKDALVSHLKNEAEPARGLVPEGIAVNPVTQEDFRKENGSFLNRDVTSAQKFFKEGLNELRQEKVKLELMGDETESAVETLKFLQRVWMDAFPELEVTIQSIPFTERLKKDAAGEYDVQISGWAADYSDPMNFLEIWESSSPQNTSAFSNETFDSLIQQAKTSTSKSKRWETLLEAEQRLLEQGAVIPLYQPYNVYLCRTDVKNVVVHPAGPSLSFKWATVAH